MTSFITSDTKRPSTFTLTNIETQVLAHNNGVTLWQWRYDCELTLGKLVQSKTQRLIHNHQPKVKVKDLFQIAVALRIIRICARKRDKKWFFLYSCRNHIFVWQKLQSDSITPLVIHSSSIFGVNRLWNWQNCELLAF